MSRPIDISGQRFGRLIAIERVEVPNSTRAMWRCKCDCGNEKITSGVNLRRGKALSCGCLHKETVAKINKETKTKHGESQSRLYSIWRGMKKRCYCKKHEAYHNYGGRGISICDDWLSSFEKFQKWALSHGYDKSMTIDRVDVNGNYEPQNCRFITKAEQSRNRRTNHLLTLDGETKTISEWAEITGLGKNVILSRVNMGWTDEDALRRPKRHISRI